VRWRKCLIPTHGGVVRDPCFPGDRRGPKCNPAAAKCIFGPGGGSSHTCGPCSQSGGFWA
jgi:hypothetical protein